MMTYDERKQLLFRRIKDDLPDVLNGNESTTDIEYSQLPDKVSLYLDDLLLISKGIIIEAQYPYPSDDFIYPDDVKVQYRTLQVQIAIEIFNKEGAEGQTSHSEGSISRSYSSADISIELMNRITPMCGVL